MPNNAVSKRSKRALKPHFLVVEGGQIFADKCLFTLGVLSKLEISRASILVNTALLLPDTQHLSHMTSLPKITASIFVNIACESRNVSICYR